MIFVNLLPVLRLMSVHANRPLCMVAYVSCNQSTGLSSMGGHSWSPYLYPLLCSDPLVSSLHVGLFLCVLVFSLLLGLLICCWVSPNGFVPCMTVDIVSGGCVILLLYLLIIFPISLFWIWVIRCKYFLYLWPPAFIFVSVYPPYVFLTPPNFEP